MINAEYKKKCRMAGIGLENIFCWPNATNSIVFRRSGLWPEKETSLPKRILRLIFFTLIKKKVEPTIKSIVKRIILIIFNYLFVYALFFQKPRSEYNVQDLNANLLIAYQGLLKIYLNYYITNRFSSSYQ